MFKRLLSKIVAYIENRYFYTSMINPMGPVATTMNNGLVCGNCEHIFAGRADKCPKCESKSIAPLQRMLAGKAL